MKRFIVIVLWFALLMPAYAANPHTVENLVEREFRIEDHWTGHELAFRRQGAAIIAVWRTLGSGIPVTSEAQYAVTMRSQRQCVFHLERDRKRYEVKVSLTDEGQVRAYLDGFRIYLEEISPIGSPVTD